MTSNGQSRPQRAAIRAETGAVARRGRPITAEERDALRRATVPEWSALVLALVEDGVPKAEIGRAAGGSVAAVSARLRRQVSR
jgi:plasmid stability protein